MSRPALWWLIASSLVLWCLPMSLWASPCVFAWDAPRQFTGGPIDPNVVAYRLYDSPTPGGTYTLRQTITAPATDNAASPVACTPGTYWVVVAVNAETPVAQSPLSNEIQLAGEAAQVQLLRGRVITQGRVILR